MLFRSLGATQEQSIDYYRTAARSGAQFQDPTKCAIQYMECKMASDDVIAAGNEILNA